MIDLSKLLFSLLATQTWMDYAFIDYPRVRWLWTISHKLSSILTAFSRGNTKVLRSLRVPITQQWMANRKVGDGH